GDAELTASRLLPLSSNAIPLGAARVVSVLWPTFSLTGPIVVFGVGSPEVAICEGVNLTSVFGAFALLDHRSPALSKTRAHGALIDIKPSSSRITSGTSTVVPLPSVGR